MFPTLRDNPDHTAILNQVHFDRLQGYLDDACRRGVPLVQINPAREILGDGRGGGPARRIMAPVVLLDPPDDSLVMQNEIFGPLLPVKSYHTVDEAIACINARPRPLALYVFGSDPEEVRKVLTRTVSGGACVNDVMSHALQEDAPLGGCGESGMGAYHGEAGFRTFSHARTVFTAPRLDVARALRPPYGAGVRRVLGWLIRK
jgi:coniferyl-aldehyde dehydrogenase